MTTPLPLLPVTPSAGAALPALSVGNGGAVAELLPNGANAEFAALMAQQILPQGAELPSGGQILPTPVAVPGRFAASTELAPNAEANLVKLLSGGIKSAPEASGLVALISPGLEPDPSTLGTALAGAEKVVASETTNDSAVALARAVATTLAEAGEPAPVLVAKAEGDEAAASIIVLNEPPTPPPDEDALTDAAGGKDEGADAIDAALAAALSIGVVPPQGDRLVQSAVLPTAVRSASSVRILDQLLDKLKITPANPTLVSATGEVGIGASPSLDFVGSLPLAQPMKLSDIGTSSPSRPVPEILIPGVPTPLAEARPSSPDLPDALPNFTGVQARPMSLDTIGADGEVVIDIPDALSLKVSVDSPVAAKKPALPGDATAPMGAPHMTEELRRVLAADDSLNLRFSVAPDARADSTALATPTDAAPAVLAAQASGSLVGRASGNSADGQGAAQNSAPGASPSGQGIAAAGADLSSSSGDASDFLMSGQDFSANNLTGLDVAGQPADEASGFGTLLSLSPNAGIPGKPVSAMLPHHPNQPMIPPSDVAVHIAAAARNGARNLSIQLQPAALGRIEVDLSVSREGTVKARIQAERSDTLELLQRDARGLERALEAAGLKAETGGLSFSLKDGGRQDRQSMPNPLPRDLLLTELSSESVVATRQAYRSAGSGGRALDIEV